MIRLYYQNKSKWINKLNNMATLTKVITLLPWWLSITSRFPFDFDYVILDICEKGSGTKEIQQLKYLSMKIQEVASNVASTVNTGIPGTQGHFEIKLPLNNVDGLLWWTSSLWRSSCRKYFCKWFQINYTNDK